MKERAMSEEKETPKRITRRGFVKGAAAVAGVGALASCAPAATPAPADTPVPCPTCPAAEECPECPPCTAPGVPETWDRGTDVVIVGAGGSGLAAAIEASGAGAEVIVLEKAPVIGGDTALNGGVMAGYETRLAKEKGIHVSLEQIKEFVASRLHMDGPVEPEIESIILERCGETIDWLATMGVAFKDEVVPHPQYSPVLPLIHWTDGGGKAYGEPLLAAAQERGAEVLLETRATALVADNSGRVIGVTAESNGDTIHIKARKATVLCSGGYGGSPKMVSLFVPGLAGVGSICAPSNTGDGLTMGADQGSLIVRMSFYPNVFPTVDVETGHLLMYDAMNQGGILLNEVAERFCNEDLPTYTELPVAMLKQIAQQEDRFVWMLMNDSPELQYTIEIFGPNLAKADTIEDLAGTAGLDPSKVKAAVDRYNQLCATGDDTDFGRMTEYLIPINTPPFYLAKVDCRTVTTGGGLKTDTEARVLRFTPVGNEDGVAEPIPGLYAAGSTVERNNIDGWTVSGVFTMGRIAGQNAAAEASWE
jgi:flavocytochrome c